ncbi:hypothetical protein GALMADRAFT_54809 [Galerina marginata CBS 339.88]|uniref:Big-1 domain-containing protein n=1 Tax=Galerina marginata (strain CBS 339.88) TaxID=685588 RepID=A0A067TN77_GALM3|nr:hypothetical protein GALMADRAFT_54809 [Galerina marginata CBS 339.88]
MHFHWLPSISLLLSAVTYASPAANTPTQVNLRIEGAQRTIFEGSVVTTAHNVTTSLGGTHKCDGTNEGANSSPGPTTTAALDDTGKQHGFLFDGLFISQFDDFIISTIAGESADSISNIWISGVNFFPQDIFTGCKQEVKAGDNIVFALVSVSGPDPLFLKLLGPTTARVNQAVTFTVVEGTFLTPIKGAVVNGKTTDANGKVAITFTQTGVNSAKADLPGSVRSNRVDVQVTN